MNSITILLLILVSMSQIGAQTNNPTTPAESIKQRMMRRLPEVVELKRVNKIIEGDDGYLKVTAGVNLIGPLKRLVNDENIDREAIYEIIGRRATPKLTREQVGLLRARM